MPEEFTTRSEDTTPLPFIQTIPQTTQTTQTTVPTDTITSTTPPAHYNQYSHYDQYEQYDEYADYDDYVQQPTYEYDYECFIPALEQDAKHTPEEEPQHKHYRGKCGRVKNWIISHIRDLSRKQRIFVGISAVAVFSILVVGLSAHNSSAVHVARLNHAMNSGDEITASDVEWVSVPHSLLPNHAITQENHVIGKHLIGDADDGELLTSARLSSPHLPRRWRALEVPTNGTNVWQPGQHVDVVVTSKERNWVLCHDAIIQENNAHAGQTINRTATTIVALPENDAYELARLDDDAVVTLLLH